ncbi:MAG: ABC transporter ATP-binding protein, partial [Pelagerythrobacter marensis]
MSAPTPDRTAPTPDRTAPNRPARALVGTAQVPDGTAPAPLLEVSGLQVGYRTRRGLVEAVRGVDLTVAPGTMTALV